MRIILGNILNQDELNQSKVRLEQLMKNSSMDTHKKIETLIKESEGKL